MHEDWTANGELLVKAIENANLRDKGLGVGDGPANRYVVDGWLNLKRVAAEFLRLRDEQARSWSDTATGGQ